MTAVSVPGPDGMILRDARRGCWLRFGRPESVVAARSVPEVGPSLRAVEEAVERRGLWAAGFIAYEAAPAFDTALRVRPDRGFPLAWFALCQPPRAVARLPEPPPAAPARWRPSVSSRAYGRAVRRIREYIRAGDTYQVNYTFRLVARRLRDPWGLFLTLAAAQDPAFGAWIAAEDWIVCSASPELFLRLDGDRVESRPMKGTAARGPWPSEDLRRAAALRASEKDRAENIMIVDMVRNDLGRIATPGTVRVARRFAVERLPTVWQMTSTVRASTRAPLWRILEATFPPASITGAPKARTMEIIRELETDPRRVYTGAVGFIAPRRRAQFSVAIRTALVERATGAAEYGVGGGIVWDSVPDLERAECSTKALILRAAPERFDLLETMLWTPGTGYRLLGAHLKRMAESAAYFGRPLDAALVRRRLRALARRLPRAEHRVRVLAAKDGTVRCEAALLRPPGPGAAARVALAASPVDSGSVFLYHKTTNRRAYEEALAARPGYDDVLLYNGKGEVTESAIGNVAVRIGGALCTPPVRCGLLAGTQRALMLRRGELVERAISVDEALRSRGIYLMNSVRGMYPARLERPGRAAPGRRSRRHA